MSIRNLLVGSFITIVALFGVSLFIYTDAAATPSDGKTCTEFPIGGLVKCPPGQGIADLSSRGYVLVPDGSRCFLGDDRDGEASTRSFSCNYDSNTHRGSVQIFAGLTAIRDKAIQDWRSANPGQGNPTEGQIYTLINTQVYAVLTGDDESINDQDCSLLSGVAKTRCETVQACVAADPGGNITQCLNQWTTCMNGATDQGTADKCAEEILASFEEDEAPGSNCNVEGGLSWILCPMINTLASLNDAAFGAIQRFLDTPALNTNTADSENGVYIAWKIMRDIANAAFVIVFLIIIFSQITSVGVSNYGVKKMLPKLIAGAILVNTSFWIAAILVDISNLVGANIYALFSNIADEIPIGSSDGGGMSWATIALLTIGAGAVAVMVGLSVVLPLIVSAFFLAVGLLLTLAFRHAMVIFLIVMSPLAFVAYLLPNTERLFKMWWGLLKVLLLLYPIIALLFGTSLIAARVIYSAGAQNNDTILMAFGAFLPFIAMLGIKGVFDATKGILGKIGFSNPLGGVTGAAKSAAKNYGKRQDNINSTARVTGKGNVFRRGAGAMRFSRTRSKGRAIDGAAERNLRMADARYIADEVEGGKESLLHKATGGRLGTDNKMASALSGGMGEEGKYAAIGSAVEAQAKFEAEEVTAQNAIIKSLNLTNEQQAMLATGREVAYTDRNGNTRTLGGNDDNNIALRMAAQQSIAKSGDAELINHVIDNKMRSLDANQSNDSKELANFADALASSSNKPAYIQAGDIENIRNRGKTIADINNPSVTRVAGNNLSSGNLIETALTQNVYSPERLATTGRQEANVVVNHAENNMAAGSTGRVRLRDNAEAVFNDPELTLKVGKQREALTRATYL